MQALLTIYNYLHSMRYEASADTTVHLHHLFPALFPFAELIHLTAEIQTMCVLWKTWRVRAPLEPCHPTPFGPAWKFNNGNATYW